MGAWQSMMEATSKLYTEARTSKPENDMFQMVLSKGSSRQTEDAVNALNVFLKEYRNTALRNLAQEAMTKLMQQRRANAGIEARRAGESSCPTEVKICPNGTTMVSRQGSHCAFAACPTEAAN